MESNRICTNCEKPLLDDAPLGLCPSCLLLSGFASEAAPQATVPSDIPGVDQLRSLFPQLEILELIGRGGMGAVYKARQPLLGRLVALKILLRDNSPAGDFAERFRREAQVLAQLSHPNIVGVHDSGEVDGLYYLVMEYVDGVNLRQLQATGSISAEEALAIVPPICEALQYAHQKGLVHRDIKPENILLDKQGTVKIADFGIAKMLSREGMATPLTKQQVIGTPLYMAPEQIERPQAVDRRADIYSLGVVLYEMLTGELPLGRFAPPSKRVEVDVRLDEVVLRALEKQPELRYQEAAQLKTDVETIATTPAPSAAAAPAPRPVPSERRISPAAKYVLGALLLAGVFGAGLLVNDLGRQHVIPGDEAVVAEVPLGRRSADTEGILTTSDGRHQYLTPLAPEDPRESGELTAAAGAEGQLHISPMRQWSRTGIRVEAGQILQIQAEGQVHGCPGPAWAYGPWTPQGGPSDRNARARVCALIGKIAGNGSDHVFLVGDRYEDRVGQGGELLLGVSDIWHWDNSGEFRTRVTVDGKLPDLSSLPKATPAAGTATAASSNQSSPTTGSLVLLQEFEAVEGTLHFHGRYRHKSRGRDIDLPGELWIKERPDKRLAALASLPFSGSSDLALGGPGTEAIERYVSHGDGTGGRPGYRIEMELTSGTVRLTRRGVRHDVDRKELPVPGGSWFDPNSRPDSYCAANLLLRAFALREGETKDFPVYDWDNSGEGLAGYTITIRHAGKEKVTVPAGIFEANHLVLSQKTSADTWFKKRAGHVTEFWVLDNGILVRVLRHREPYEMVLLDTTTPEALTHAAP